MFRSTHPALALFLTGILSLSSADALAQQDSPKNFEPVRGQSGKDVIWIPTPIPLVEKMLNAAKVTQEDRVFDLGAGDGIIAITAAKKFGAQSVGIEYNPQMADFARRKVAEAGVTDKVRIITGDIFKEDFSSATVVTMYLLPDLNLRLRPTLLGMKPGTRIVSHAFTMGAWEPDEILDHEAARAYLWIVPAKLEGDWNLTGMKGRSVRLSFRQNLQAIGGLMTQGRKTQPLVGARVRGEEIRFQFTGADGSPHTFEGRVNGSKINGTVESGEGMRRAVEMTRL